MARSAKAGSKKSAAKTRKARLAKGLNPKTGVPKALGTTKKASRTTPSTTDVKKQIARQARELEEARQRQVAASSVLHIIGASPGALPSVFREIVKNAVEVCGGRFGALFKMEDNLLHLMADYHLPGAQRQLLEALYPMAPSRGHVSGRAVLTRSTVQIPDTEADKGYWRRNDAKQSGFRSLLATPLLKGNQAIGAIVIYKTEPGAFPARQLTLLQNFAAQAVIAIENARLFEEVQARTRDLQESLQQQTATADVLKVISRSAFNLQEVFDTLVESAAHLCEADHAWLLQREGDFLQFKSSFGHGTATHERIRQLFLSRPLPIDRGTIVGRSVIGACVVQVTDVLADPNYTFTEGQEIGGYRAGLGAPLLRDGIVIGVIFVAKTRSEPFSAKQIELITTFADQAVIAISNVSLFEEVQARTRDLQESLQQQTATADVLKVISRSAFDLQAVLDTLIESAVTLSGGSLGAIFQRRGELFHLTATHGYPPEMLAFGRANPIAPGLGSNVGRTAMTGTLVQIPDVIVDPDFTAYGYQRVGKYRAMLGIPLMRDGKIEGVFSLAKPEPGLFAQRQVELVQTFADQAVIAIENARLFEEVKTRTRDLSESLQQQTATADVLKVISRSAFDLQLVLDTLTESAARLCNADMAAITRSGPDGYYHATSYNFSVDWLKLSETLRLRPGKESIVGRALLAQKAVQIADVSADADYGYPDVQKAAGYRTLLGVPLLRDREPIGVLFLGRKTVSPFSDQQVELVSTFADQAVIAIENVRLFDEVQARTRDLSESLQQQTATADVLKVISRSVFDLHVVLQTLVETVARLCDADMAQITRQLNGVFFRAEAYGFPQEFIEYSKTIPVIPDRGSAIGRALLEGKASNVPDALADPDYTFTEGIRLANFRAVLAVPMLRESTPIGVIVMTRKEPRPFTEKQISLAMTFADQAAIAIGNVQLFDQVQARTRELAKSLDDLRTAQDRLIQTEKLASLGQLTAGIAHEIKNPLNFVNNFSSLSAELVTELDETLAPARLDQKMRGEVVELTKMLKSNLEKVVQHGKRADSIVKNMLQHSREGSGERRSHDLNALIGESLNLAYHGARAERSDFNITLKQNLDPDAGAVEVYPQELTRALLNLISNGFYAAIRRKIEEGGKSFEPVLSATTRNLGESVEIRIRDNGTGIPPDVREKMFNPFFTTKPTGEGTGLGLSMTHDIIVKQHGGRIDVDTELGAFSEFIIILPRGNENAGRMNSE
jgi:GAF domain-containing protein